MAPRPPANIDEVRRFWEQYDALAPELVQRIESKLAAGKEARAATAEAFQELQIRPRLTVYVTQGMAGSAVAGGAIANLDALEEWARAYRWGPGMLSLSEKITHAGLQSIVSDAVSAGVNAGKTWTKLAQDIATVPVGDIPAHLTALESAARRAIIDPADLREYQAALGRSRRNIARLARGGAPTGRLKHAYAGVVAAAERGSEKAIDTALRRAVNEKARYNATRIARTEMARAYGQGFFADVAGDSDVVGVRWALSSRHVVTDICDFHAGVDMYGLGSGVYPKALVPPYPAHPHCLCNLLRVYRGSPRGADPEQARRWIERRPEREQKQLLGVAGQKAFADDPSSWPATLRQWHGHEQPVSDLFGAELP